MRVIDRLPRGCSGRPLTMIWEVTPGQGGMGKRCGTLYPERRGHDAPEVRGHEPDVMLSTCTYIFPRSSYHNSGKGGTPFHKLGNWAGMR